MILLEHVLTTKLFWSGLLSVVMLSQLQAQNEHQSLREGTVAYEQQKFEEAEGYFQRALNANENSLKGSFNLGNSLFKLKRFDEAALQFEQATHQAEDDQQKSKAFYNLGNTRLAQAQNQAGIPQGGQAQLAVPSEESQEQLEQAIDAYKRALRYNSQDYDAKNNLAAAYRLLRKQQQQQQEQQQNQQNNNQEQDQDQDQENKQQQDKEQQNQEQQEQEQQEQNQQNQEQQQPPKNQEQQEQPSQATEAKPMKKDEVERLMDIIEQEDKRVQEKMMKRKRLKQDKPEKDW